MNIWSANRMSFYNTQTNCKFSADYVQIAGTDCVARVICEPPNMRAVVMFDYAIASSRNELMKDSDITVDEYLKEVIKQLGKRLSDSSVSIPRDGGIQK